MGATIKPEWSFWRQAVLHDNVVPYSFRCSGQLYDWAHPVLGAEPISLEPRRKYFPEAECVEWALHLSNPGATDTPILSELLSIDLTIAPALEKRPVVIHAVHGCDYGEAPFTIEHIVPERNKPWRIGNPGGGKTWQSLPFLNLDFGERGLFCALGWPGRWMLTVEHRDDGIIRLMGGIERAELSLHPDEAISLPTVLLMFWEGDRIAAHNRFRKHILNHHSPTCNGEPTPDLSACAAWGGMKTNNHLRLIETIRQQQVPFDLYWVDAGWYGAAHETEEYQSLKTEDWFFHVGDWRPNVTVHPNGLKPISEAAHAAGMKFLLWFEIERAIETSPWILEHPDWYFERRNSMVLAGRTCHWRVFNFGNPEARQAMTDHIARLISDNGIDIFRQDCNVWLSPCWDENDTTGHVGMAEIRYVEGLLTFWDTLRQRFPHLIIDAVQRRDLATVERALDFSRADIEFLPHTDVIASQTALYGLSHWMPLSGTGTPYRPGRDYEWLSGLSPSYGASIFPGISDVPVQVGPPVDYPWDWLRRMLTIQRRARPFFRGDFYPLLDHVSSNQHWEVMQFHRPDLEAGMVLVYRRPDSPFTAAQFPLRGIPEDSFCQLDPGDAEGFKLVGNVLEICFSTTPAAAVVFYRVCKTA